ncbi:MAG: hypothetical protein GW913_15165 [Myxococcales bacterium]|nr:hypothetical protein [Myxococcales bacterium]
MQAVAARLQGLDVVLEQARREKKTERLQQPPYKALWDRSLRKAGDDDEGALADLMTLCEALPDEAPVHRAIADVLCSLKR